MDTGTALDKQTPNPVLFRKRFQCLVQVQTIRLRGHAQQCIALVKNRRRYFLFRADHPNTRTAGAKYPRLA
jgi:hypothetical protein